MAGNSPRASHPNASNFYRLERLLRIKVPFGVISIVTSLPGTRPILSRTSAGKVICPFEEIVRTIMYRGYLDRRAGFNFEKSYSGRNSSVI